MDFTEVVRSRRMCRDFRSDPLAAGLVDRLLAAAGRAPSAGWTQATEFLVLEGPSQTERFWSHSFPDGRASFRWQGLFDAPVLIVPLTRPQAYVERYSEADKAATGLGDSIDDWPVPYWHVDAAMAVENLLLAATDAGLGALFFGIFRGEAEILGEFDVPDGWHAVGAAALGYERSHAAGRSVSRGRRAADELVHRGHW